jgi:hypothetical protein
MVLYWKWWENSVPNNELSEICYDTGYNFDGLTTTDIIYNIIRILSIEPRKKNWGIRRFY